MKNYPDYKPKTIAGHGIASDEWDYVPVIDCLYMMGYKNSLTVLTEADHRLHGVLWDYMQYSKVGDNSYFQVTQQIEWPSLPLLCKPEKAEEYTLEPGQWQHYLALSMITQCIGWGAKLLHQDGTVALCDSLLDKAHQVARGKGKSTGSVAIMGLRLAKVLGRMEWVKI